MKTFETEKHNIPEGATHYIEESRIMTFGWAKGLGTDGFSVYPVGSGEGRWIGTSEPIHSGVLKPIPQAKEVEWVNGDKCSYEADNDSHTFIAMTSDSKCCIRYDVANNFFEVCIGEISKPETEAERVERERVNAIAEMALVATSPEFGWAINDRLKEICSKIHDAGYRKES